jgi:hypothetical protein
MDNSIQGFLSDQRGFELLNMTIKGRGRIAPATYLLYKETARRVNEISPRILQASRLRIEDPVPRGDTRHQVRSFSPPEADRKRLIRLRPATA